MKYIQKFNESKENYITQSDFDKIEDLFLFWSDEGNQVNYLQQCKNDGVISVSPIKNSEIQDNCVAVNLKFPCYRNTFQDFEKVFGFIPSRNADEEYSIANGNDIEKRHGPFPDKPVSNIQKILNKLDAKYKIKKDITDILNRTKGLDHYGLLWSLTFDCNLAVYRGFFLKGFEFSVNIKLRIIR